MKSLKVLVLLIALWMALPATAATIKANSCSQTGVQEAVNSAADGDTVTVPAGSCTWSTAVTIPSTKGITLQGAGIGSTVITGTANPSLQINLASGNSLTRVTGFTFLGNNVGDTNGLIAISYNSDAQNAFRFDHNAIDNVTGGRAIAVNENAYDASGLIDHNTITKPSGTLQGITIFAAPYVSTGSDPTPGAQFAKPVSDSLGGSHNIFVEANTFDYSAGDATDGAFDTAGPARLVFRYNHLIHTDIGNHGADSGGYRGAYTIEVYDNNFDNAGYASIWPFINIRSGTWMIYDNTVSGTFSDGVLLHNYRSCSVQNAVWAATGGGTGMCDGSNSWDQNAAGQNGCACLDQVGHHFGTTMTGTNTLVPLYSWNNGGETAYAAPINAPSDCTKTGQDIQQDRDFFDYNASFNGTSGVGRGTLAARPATCTTSIGGYSGANPAYWATDTNTLYACTATNTWTAYYTPYTYPHPLQSGPNASAPAAPTKLAASVN